MSYTHAHWRLFSVSMESIFARLLIPDNETIRQVIISVVLTTFLPLVTLIQATAELQEIYKHPSIVPSLCEVLEGSQNPQVHEKFVNKCVTCVVCVTLQYRQYAAVLLRKRLVKLWKKLDDDVHSKYNLLHCTQRGVSTTGDRHCQLFAFPSLQLRKLK